MNILFKCIFGSALYGTDTPESDKDYKGIFLPSLDSLILQTAPKNVSTTTKSGDRLKNNAMDIDEELYSLHYFLKLAIQGETGAMDILHCPDSKTLITSPEWQFIRANRKRFYTKSMKSFLSYARKQAGRYGCKGSRLNAAQTAIKLLEAAPADARLADLWDSLPVNGEELRKYEHDIATQEDKRVWDVCGRKLMATTPVTKCLETVQKFCDAYGERAKLAADNEGIDWKAISHAFRAGYQCLEIYKTGDLIYPLKDAEFLKKVKGKQFHYTNDGIAEKLDTLIGDVEMLAEKADLPEKVDAEFWNSWLLATYSCFKGPQIIGDCAKVILKPDLPWPRISE